MPRMTIEDLGAAAAAAADVRCGRRVHKVQEHVGVAGRAVRRERRRR